ncbi:MAG: hypothetical protein Q7R45_17705, partial [Sulfuricaulis sp.]|nr:hypothetical protein [Sulfuricaulis sp.]
SDGTNASLAFTPEAFPFTPPSPLSQSAGRSRGNNVSSSAGRSSARSSARHNSHARGSSTVHASSRAVSVSEGESEAYLTRYEDRPTEFFSLEEQLHKVTAALINLPRRQYCAKIEDQAPYIARTPDLVPAFKTAAFRDEMLARFMSGMARRSPYLVPAEQVDAEIAARGAHILERPNTPEPEFTEPVPIIEGLERARQLFNKTPPAADKSSSSPATSKPKLRVVEGGKDGGDIDNA